MAQGEELALGFISELLKPWNPVEVSVDLAGNAPDEYIVRVEAHLAPEHHHAARQTLKRALRDGVKIDLRDDNGNPVIRSAGGGSG